VIIPVRNTYLVFNVRLARHPFVREAAPGVEPGLTRRGRNRLLGKIEDESIKD